MSKIECPRCKTSLGLVFIADKAPALLYAHAAKCLFCGEEVK